MLPLFGTPAKRTTSKLLFVFVGNKENPSAIRISKQNRERITAAIGNLNNIRTNCILLLINEEDWVGCLYAAVRYAMIFLLVDDDDSWLDLIARQPEGRKYTLKPN